MIRILFDAVFAGWFFGILAYLRDREPESAWLKALCGAIAMLWTAWALVDAGEYPIDLQHAQK